MTPGPEARPAAELYRDGVLALRGGRAREAVRLLAEAVATPGAQPAWALAYGLALDSAGMLDEAGRVYEQAVARQPNLPEPWFCLGVARAKQRRQEEAAAAFDRCAALDPGRAEALNQAGLALAALGRFSEAAERLAAARARGLAAAQHLNNLGYVLHRAGRLDEAAEALAAAIAADPRLAPAHNNLGTVHHARGDMPAALACYEAALALDPQLADARVNLALATFRSGDTARAREAAGAARSLPVRGADAAKNLGQLFRELDDADAALALFREAVAADPGNARARVSLATALLERGEWTEAWEHYRYRSTRAAHPLLGASGAAPMDAPLPSDLGGRTLALADEQGLGDVLFFLRFAPQLRARGARLLFHGDRRLIPLLEPTGLFDELHPREAPLPAGEALLVPDLPRLLGAATASPVPPPLPLRLPAACVEAARMRLAALGPRPWVGLTWRAGIRPATGDWVTHLFKEVPVDPLGAALGQAPGTLVSLQRQPDVGEVARLAARAGRAVHDLATANDDLVEVAAVLSALDGYVGVSSTNMHIRAGLGASADVLVPHPPEWRWMAAGASSPWFPGFRLHRESPSEGWGPALKALARSLASPA